MREEQKEDLCDGYLKPPHSGLPVVYLVLPDGRREGLCQVCATRWLLSDEEWPPKNPKHEAKQPSLASNEIST